MKIARIEHGERLDHAATASGGFHIIEGDIFGKFRVTDEFIPEDTAAVLAPIDPPQIVAIGRNYAEHAAETGSEVPDAPLVFIKTLNALADPGEPILLPKMAPGEVDYEAELAVVIGKEAKQVSPQDVDDYILGYTCANDVSARDCQLRKDKQWARGKCFDTFAPLGPWIQTQLDPDNATISLELNGEVMQDSNTSNMIFGPRYLVSYVSRCMTLYPGSVILTGTPPGVGEGRSPKIFLRKGDTVTVSIGGIGKLTNPVELEK
ncbi:MAG: fumarylacetoacetate hydrolase family protein [Phycisphaerales bacterium]|jgi:2-keto-4-pentenoate hydratase/2-oxohepta-3-ene-1,7-dioic acid hydratase in catechol pathway|nr:fumarylacetoacetate hydrolase family protein [Phycisphaerales bacterium]